MDFLINWTFVISVAMLALAGMATLIKIFGTKKPEQPGESPACKEQQGAVARAEKDAKDSLSKTEALKDIVSGIQQDVAGLKSDTKNLEKSVDDMKVSNRDLTHRLEVLLQQLIDWMNAA